MKTKSDALIQASRRTPVLVAVALLLTASAAWLVASGTEETHEALPFDPLSEAEQEQAIQIALEDPQVEITLSDRHEVIGAALNTDKQRMRTEGRIRMADVWIYDYQVDMTTHAVVDLQRGAVHALSQSDHQPPITTTEMQRAGALALEDARVQDALEERGHYEEIHPIARLWSGDAPTACPEHRCALVAFLIDGEYRGDLFVRVNLSLDQVEALLEPGHEESAREVHA